MAGTACCQPGGPGELTAYTGVTDVARRVKTSPSFAAPVLLPEALQLGLDLLRLFRLALGLEQGRELRERLLVQNLEPRLHLDHRPRGVERLRVVARRVPVQKHAPGGGWVRQPGIL